MVKSLSIPSRLRSLSRSTLDRKVRSHVRHTNRSCIRNLFGSQFGQDYLSQALTAFTRAIRAHRRLARLAPEFFDSTEVDRLARQRKEDAEWRAIWEPALNRVYGSSPDEKRACDPSADLPQLPKSSRTRRAVEREFESWSLWMSAGKLAMARYRQRRPHDVPSLTRIARLLQIAFDFAHLADGSPPSKEELKSSGHDQALADLKRIYGKPSVPFSAPEPLKSQAEALAPASASSSSPRQSPTASSPGSSPPVDTKRDFIPCSLVIGPHGLLCLQPIEESSPAPQKPEMMKRKNYSGRDAEVRCTDLNRHQDIPSEP
jgi:hypothetical protein